jgi:curved DNA-binding protein CbpA
MAQEADYPNSRSEHGAQNAGNAEAAERFKIISAAFAVLSDEGKRQVRIPTLAILPIAALLVPSVRNADDRGQISAIRCRRKRSSGC